MPDWMRPGQASAMTGLHRRTLSRYAEHGLIKSKRLPGGHRWYLRIDIEAIANGDAIEAHEPVPSP